MANVVKISGNMDKVAKHILTSLESDVKELQKVSTAKAFDKKVSRHIL